MTTSSRTTNNNNREKEPISDSDLLTLIEYLWNHRNSSISLRDLRAILEAGQNRGFALALGKKVTTTTEPDEDLEYEDELLADEEEKEK